MAIGSGSRKGPIDNTQFARQSQLIPLTLGTVGYATLSHVGFETIERVNYF
jgi:hypothetical protein